MIDTLYVFFRGASGFAFIAMGVGFFVEPGNQRVRKAFGILFAGLGALFMFSWLSEYWILPVFLDSFMVIAAVFMISQALFEISLYLFGDEKIHGSRLWVYRIGAAWSLALWLLPFLDRALGLPVLHTSVEDARPMALFQTISTTGLYAWPVAITIISLLAGKWRLSDIPDKPGARKTLAIGVAGLIIIFGLIGTGLILSSQALYRAGHLALEFMMLTWAFYYRARPDSFLKARKQIGLQHKQRQNLSPAETARIAERLQRLVKDEHVCTESSLDLRILARKMHIPSYRMSAYFNSRLGMSFPEWLNAARINYVCSLLKEDSSLSILEISMEAGYASKAVFNSQFLKRTGMSPSEYRALMTSNSGIVSTKQDAPV
jgi:AraC-like DNA-binding protein